MRKVYFCLLAVFLAAWPPAQHATGWEWHLAAGPWTLEPFTSPVERQAVRLVSEEAARLLAPLLSDFTVFAFEPQIDLQSHGRFAALGCWRRLQRDRFALGVSVYYLDFSLPFTLTAEQDIYFLDIPLAHIHTSGQGQVDLRTLMLALQGRWRAFHSGRIGLYASLGLTLLHFHGTLHLPLTARVQTILGTIELNKTEDKTLAELRKENHSLPTLILSPALSFSLHYRTGAKIRLFIEAGLSQGTFLAVGLITGR